MIALCIILKLFAFYPLVSCHINFKTTLALSISMFVFVNKNDCHRCANVYLYSSLIGSLLSVCLYARVSVYCVLLTPTHRRSAVFPILGDVTAITIIITPKECFQRCSPHHDTVRLPKAFDIHLFVAFIVTIIRLFVHGWVTPRPATTTRTTTTAITKEMSWKINGMIPKRQRWSNAEQGADK